MGTMRPSDLSEDQDPALQCISSYCPRLPELPQTLHCLALEPAFSLDGFRCEGPKEASQAARSPPEFMSLARRCFLLSSSELQCPAPPASLPGPHLAQSSSIARRWSFLCLHDLVKGDLTRLGSPRVRSSLFCLQTESVGLSPASGRGPDFHP